MDATYTAVATSSGRDSRAVSSDGRLDVDLALPKELGGTGQGTNPEQLLAAGWAACFSTVMDLIAQNKGLDASDVAVTAEASLVPQGWPSALSAPAAGPRSLGAATLKIATTPRHPGASASCGVHTQPKRMSARVGNEATERSIFPTCLRMSISPPDT